MLLSLVPSARKPAVVSDYMTLIKRFTQITKTNHKLKTGVIMSYYIFMCLAHGDTQYSTVRYQPGIGLIKGSM